MIALRILTVLFFIGVAVWQTRIAIKFKREFGHMTPIIFGITIFQWAMVAFQIYINLIWRTGS